MAVRVRVHAGEVSVRRAGWPRRCGVAFATAVGVLATGNVVVQMINGGWASAATLGFVGLALVHWVLAFATASVVADHDGLRARTGLLHRRVAAGDVQEIRVGGPTGESRVVLSVVRTAGRPRRIKTVQQIYSDKNRGALDDAAVELSRALGLAVHPSPDLDVSTPASTRRTP